MAARKSHLKVLLIFVKEWRRFADAVFAVSLSRLTDTSLLPPFVIVWKGLNCITCKWRDLIFAHYLFIRENEQNISGSPNEGGWRRRERRAERQTVMISQTERRKIQCRGEVAGLHCCPVAAPDFRDRTKTTILLHVWTVWGSVCVYVIGQGG